MRKFTYVILLMYLTNSAGKSKTKFHRILGGTVAKNGEFPFFAQLRLDNLVCGASLITPEWLVSAGHCFYNNIKNLDKMADENKLKVYMKTNIRYDERADINFIKKVHFHPDFKLEEDDNENIVKIRNDIVLALLRHPYRLQNAIWPIFLPKPIRNIEKWMRHCTPGIVVGIGTVKEKKNPTDTPVFGKYVEYGREYPKTLEEIAKILNPHRYMSLDSFPYNVYRNYYIHEMVNLNKSILTLTPWHKGHTMKGDSGGPFVCYHHNNAVLYGIVSTGGPRLDHYSKKYSLNIKERTDVHLEFILSMVPDVRIYRRRRIRKLGISLKQNGKN